MAEEIGVRIIECKKRSAKIAIYHFQVKSEHLAVSLLLFFLLNVV